jgi:hypothetical protein
VISRTNVHRGRVRIKLPLNKRRLRRLARHHKRLTLLVRFNEIVPSREFKAGFPTSTLEPIVIVRGRKR